MSTFDVFAARLAGRVLAPPGAGTVLAEWTAAGATGDTPLYQSPLHLHDDDEAWYVLDGVLRVRVGDDEVEVPAGGAVIVPGGTPHTYWNPSPAPARYLLVMGARTYALIQDLHSGGRPTPETYERYGATLL